MEMLSIEEQCFLKDIRWKRVIALILKEKPKRILDVGCSYGDIASILVRRGIEVFAIEIEEEKALKAKEKGLKVTTTDVSKGLPYADCFFDLVLAGEVIEHLIDTDYFLEEIHRVLRPEKAVAITTPNLLNLENRLRIIIGLYPIFVDYTSRGDNHTRVYTEKALVRQLKERNFRVEVKTGSFVPLITYSKLKNLNSKCMWFLGLLGYFFPRLALHTIIRARKI